MSAVRSWVARSQQRAIPVLRLFGRLRGCELSIDGERLHVDKNHRRITIRRSHFAYTRDLIEEFEFYFSSVEHTFIDGFSVVDFSEVTDHELAGWSLFPVTLPGLPEPMSTVNQYIDVTSLSEGQNVIDLGAYAGITACAFQEVIGKEGRVVSVEADPINLSCAQINLSRYCAVRGIQPELIHGAVWSSPGTVRFTAEGSLGSSVSELLSRSTEIGVEVEALTLSGIVERSGLDRVDVLKADVEGAEFQAFSDREFFGSFHPSIVFEPALDGNRNTSIECLRGLLEEYGYRVEVLQQIGSRLPLIKAV